MACTIEIVDGREVIHVHRRPDSLSRRAVERRVALRLCRKVGLVLRKCSARSRWHHSLGDYYLTSLMSGFVEATHQDLDSLARQYGVLAKGDEISE